MIYRLIRIVEYVVLGAILFFLGAMLLHAQPALPDPFPGYWRANNTTLPCSTVQPHLPAVDPQDGRQAYLRYDATATFISPQPDGKRAGQGGSQHTVQVYLGGQLIGLCSGLACGSSTGPREMFPAPWANPTIPDYGIPLCDYWKAQALPGATLEACPNPRTPQQYSAKVAGTSEWQAGWPLQAPNRARWCVPPRPTYTPPGPTQTPVPPSPTPTPGPDPAARYIEAIEACGITAGCGNGNFCPDRVMTRREVAVWLAKALDLELTGCRNTFADVPCVNPTPSP
jgi:hypothetical protein